MMSAHSASLATLMLANEPRMWILVSAITMRVRDAFSIVNLVFPPLPDSRPMARDRCSPRSVLTSWKVGEKERRCKKRQKECQ